MNDRLLRALRRQPVDRTPVWIMRQAGRYLPEYRATRQRAGDFLTLCKTPELACEVTLQPLARFPLDAAILFSDILTIPDAMGLGLSIDEGRGPRLERPLRSARDIDALAPLDVDERLGYVFEAVRLIRRELAGRVPLIGFAGSPWTLASYMVEGSGSRDFALVKKLIFDEPQAAHRLLGALAQAVLDYLNAQIRAGAQAIMVFDTWGGVLTPHDFEEFSLRYMRRIVEGLERTHDDARIPVTLFTKGGGQWLEKIADTGCDAVGLDWMTSMGSARRRVGSRVALQGNMDPAMLRASPARIRAEVDRILGDYGTGSGHVFNLGHGIAPDIAPEHVSVLVEAVHSASEPYHKTPS